jgi:hypothetical protein
MRSMFGWPSGFSVVGCLLAVATVMPAPRLYAGPPLDEWVREALERNAKALSPLTVTWERTRTSRLEESQILDALGLPRTAREFMAPDKARFMWDRGKFYTYYWRHVVQVDPDLRVLANKPTRVQEQEVSFDLKAFYSGNPNTRSGQRVGDPVILIDRVETMKKKRGSEHLCKPDYLYVAGFSMPQTAEELTTKSPQALPLAYLEQGGTLTMAQAEDLGETSFLVLELRKGDSRYRFFLDPAKSYAVRRWLLWDAGGVLQAQTDCLEFARLSEPDHWLPRRVEILCYHAAAGKQEPLYQESVRVSELHNNPIPPEQFVLVYRQPGSHVADGTLPGADERETGRIAYTVPANPEDLEGVIRQARRGPARLSTTTWILAVNATLLAAVGAFVIWRLVRRRAAPRR